MLAQIKSWFSDKKSYQVTVKFVEHDDLENLEAQIIELKKEAFGKEFESDSKDKNNDGKKLMPVSQYNEGWLNE